MTFRILEVTHEWCCDKMTEAYEKGELKWVGEEFSHKLMLNGERTEGKNCPFCGSEYLLMGIRHDWKVIE